MTFSRVWPGGITNGQSPQGSELTELDLHVSRALDGHSGGAYSPAGAITVGGGGIQDANALDFVVASPAQATKVVDCEDYHTISIRFAERAEERLLIDCNPSTDGVTRTIYIDNLLPTAKLEFESHGSADNWEWSNAAGAQRVCAKLFMDSGQWRLVSVCAEPVDFAPAIVDAATLPTDSTHGDKYLDLVSPHTTIRGTLSGGLRLHVPEPNSESKSIRRTVWIERFIGGPTGAGFSVVDKQYPFGAVTYAYHVNGAGFTRTLLDIFNDGDGWHVIPHREDRRRWGTRVVAGFDGELIVDSESYSTLIVTGQVRETQPERMDFVFTEPRNEGDEFVIHFDDILIQHAIGIVEFYQQQSGGTKVLLHEPGAPLALTKRNPKSAEGFTGGNNIGFRFRVVNGHWRYYGAHL